jgi:steroid delta-isomerase-like uncharacterized protein
LSFLIVWPIIPNTISSDEGYIMKAEDAVQLMKDMVAAVNSWDFKKAASFFTNDLVYEDVPSGKVCRGVKEYIDFAGMVRAEFPDRTWELKSAFSDGHKIASETVWSGAFTNSQNPDRPATGKRVTIRCISITELREGKICRNSDYYDMLSVSQQLGSLLPGMKKD